MLVLLALVPESRFFLALNYYYTLAKYSTGIIPLKAQHVPNVMVLCNL